MIHSTGTREQPVKRYSYTKSCYVLGYLLLVSRLVDTTTGTVIQWFYYICTSGTDLHDMHEWNMILPFRQGKKSDAGFEKAASKEQRNNTGNKYMEKILWRTNNNQTTTNISSPSIYLSIHQSISRTLSLLYRY